MKWWPWRRGKTMLSPMRDEDEEVAVAGFAGDDGEDEVVARQRCRRCRGKTTGTPW